MKHYHASVIACSYRPKNLMQKKKNPDFLFAVKLLRLVNTKLIFFLSELLMGLKIFGCFNIQNLSVYNIYHCLCGVKYSNIIMSRLFNARSLKTLDIEWFGLKNMLYDTSFPVEEWKDQMVIPNLFIYVQIMISIIFKNRGLIV